MGKNNPKIGEKIKQNGVTWTYKRVNTGGARGLMWTTKARIGTDGGRNIFDKIPTCTQRLKITYLHEIALCI